MIDTAVFATQMTEMLKNKLNWLRDNPHPNIKFYGNQLQLKHPFSGKRWTIKISWYKNELLFESESLAKIVQGHNIYGTNNLHWLCMEIVRKVYEILGIEFSRHERQQMDNQNRGLGFRLIRVDVACSWRLQSKDVLASCIKEIYSQTRFSGGKWSAYGRDGEIETVYNAQRSSRISDKFYNKARELLKHKIPATVADKDWMLANAISMLRFEATLRGKELKRLELDYSKDWTRTEVMAMIAKRLAKFKFTGMIKPILEPDEIAGLTSVQKTYYTLWRGGAKFYTTKDYPPLKNARNQLLDFGVDIFRSTKRGSLVSVADLLSTEKAIFAYPKSWVKKGVIVAPMRMTSQRNISS